MARVSKPKGKKTTKKPAATTPQTPQQVPLTLANAPLFQAKFLEGIMLELRAIREFMEKHG